MCPELQALQNLALHVNNQILSTMTFSADLMQNRKKKNKMMLLLMMMMIFLSF